MDLVQDKIQIIVNQEVSSVKKQLEDRYSAEILEKDSQIQEKDSQIQEKDSQIQEKDDQIKDLMKDISMLKAAIANQ